MKTTIQAPTATLVLPPYPAATVKPSHDITAAINQQLQGAFEWLQWASPTVSTHLPAQYVKDRATISGLGASATQVK